LLHQFTSQMLKYEWDNLAIRLRVLKIISITEKMLLNEEEVQWRVTEIIRRLILMIIYN